MYEELELEDSRQLDHGGVCRVPVYQGWRCMIKYPEASGEVRAARALTRGSISWDWNGCF